VEKMTDHLPGTLIYDLIQAEKHLSYVLELLYKPSGVNRGFWYRRGLLKAQSAVMTRLVKELAKEEVTEGTVELKNSDA